MPIHCWIMISCNLLLLFLLLFFSACLLFLFFACLLGRIQDQDQSTRGSYPYIAGSRLVWSINVKDFWYYLKERPCPQSQLVKVICKTNRIKTDNMDVMITITCRPNIVRSSCIGINAHFWATRVVFFRAEGSQECMLKSSFCRFPNFNKVFSSEKYQ